MIEPESKVRSVRITGAKAIVKSMEDEGVEVIFGIPGGVVLPVFDALFDSSIRNILTRHDRVPSMPPKAMPGPPEKWRVHSDIRSRATNLVTGIANANMDSIPIVAFTGQVATNLIGTDAFQEADITGITLPVAKHSFLVRTRRTSLWSYRRLFISPAPAGQARPGRHSGRRQPG